MIGITSDIQLESAKPQEQAMSIPKKNKDNSLVTLMSSEDVYELAPATNDDPKVMEHLPTQDNTSVPSGIL